MSSKHQKKSTAKMDQITGLFMVFPSIVLFAIFVYLPLIMALGYSFTDWNFYSGSTYIGIKNYIMVLKNQIFQKSLANIFWFALIIIPCQVSLSFLFAHVLKNSSDKLSSYVKTSIYVPTVISGVVASVIFLFIFNYQGGILNFIIRKLGGKRIPFLNDIVLSKWAIAITTLWMGFGYNSLVMFAGLQNIPYTYYEAAEVDGAGAFIKFTRITIPSMKNVFILVIVSLTTGTIQMFDLPYMMTGGGPVNSTLTPMMYIYNNFKSADYSMGYTVAAALLLMIIIGSVSSVVFRLISSEKAQDA